MRIATLILALILVIPLTVQSCAITGLSAVAGMEKQSGGGAMGILVALLWVVGAAFALGKPTVSVVVFLLAGMFAFIGASTGYGDLEIWGGVSVVFAALCLMGRREVAHQK
jgi:hypothetical protein